MDLMCADAGALLNSDPQLGVLCRLCQLKVKFAVCVLGFRLQGMPSKGFCLVCHGCEVARHLQHVYTPLVTASGCTSLEA